VVPLAATIGFYILVANWLDLFPITLLPNVHPANTDVNQTAAMALVVFIVVNAYAIRIRGIRGYLHHLTRPFELPIWARVFFTGLNIIEEIVKPVTLAFRLFGNLLAGLLMIFVITLLLGNLPYVGPWLTGPAAVALWKIFDVMFIGLIQAFIFMLLTIVYFGLAREGLEEKHTSH
jgi:F-type H+-transporting ATPase subunit a